MRESQAEILVRALRQLHTHIYGWWQVAHTKTTASRRRETGRKCTEAIYYGTLLVPAQATLEVTRGVYRIALSGIDWITYNEAKLAYEVIKQSTALELKAARLALATARDALSVARKTVDTIKTSTAYTTWRSKIAPVLQARTDLNAAQTLSKEAKNAADTALAYTRKLSSFDAARKSVELAGQLLEPLKKGLGELEGMSPNC